MINISIRKLWFLCEEDKFGNINQIYGGYKTKKQAEFELKRIITQYGPSDFVIRKIEVIKG